LALAACGGGEAAPITAVVDTLANGAVRVRSSADGVWRDRPEARWRIVEELRIGRIDGDGPEVFGRVGGVIPDEQGHMWVLDTQAYEIRVFDADGRFVRTVGRRGEGPGEFGGFFGPCAFPGPNGQIVVEDRLGRWQRFDTAGALVAAQPSTSNLGCGLRVWTTDGRFLVVNTHTDLLTRERSSYFVVHALDADGDLVPGDTFPSPTLPPNPTVTWVSTSGVGRIISAPPFWPRGTMLLSPTGDFWISDGGGPYTVRRQALAGDTFMVMERPYDPVPIPDSIRDRAIDDFRREGYTAENGFDPDQVPRVYPPIEQLLVAPDGTLYVRRTVAGGSAALDVFSADGHYLGEAEVGEDFARFSIRHLTSDKMYGIVQDELGVQYVVRLGIQRPGG
jgi:hypothetical protein